MDHKELKLKADEFIDSEEYVLRGELFLLRKVFESASDAKKADECHEFESRYPNTKNDLFNAVTALELYLSEFDYPKRG